MKHARLIASAIALSAATFLIGCAAPQNSSAPAAPVAKWTCTAPGLVTANYTGGSTAYVHLSRYTSGGNYSVVRNADGTASGKTADGTAFVCKTSKT